MGLQPAQPETSHQIGQCNHCADPVYAGQPAIVRGCPFACTPCLPEFTCPFDDALHIGCSRLTPAK